MPFVGEAYSTGSVPNDNLALNVRQLSGAIDTVQMAPLTGSSAPQVRITGKTLEDGYVEARVSDEGYLETRIAEPRSSFGELLTAELTPTVQIDFIYGVSNTDKVKQFLVDGGTIVQSGSCFVASVSTNSASRASLRSRKTMKYRAGQGSMARLSAIFPSPSSGSDAACGAADTENGYLFASFGTDIDGGGFYILRRSGGKRDIRALTVTTAASTVHNVTVTLNNSGTLVPVTNAAGDKNLTAWEIGKGNYSSVIDGGWEAQTSGSIVTFIHTVAASRTGSYGLASVNAVGAFSSIRSGIGPATAAVSQSAWNGDKCNGLGASGFNFDRTTGNIFQIRYQYLGFGQAEFFIQNPADNNFVKAHTIRYAGSSIHTNVNNPSLPIVWTMSNHSNITGSVYIKGASAGLFIQGKLINTAKSKKSFAYGKNGIGTSYTPVFSLRNPLVYNVTTNTTEAVLALMSAAVEGSKPSDFVIIRNGTLSGTPAFQPVDTESAILEVDIASTGVTGGKQVTAFTLSKSDSIIYDLSSFEISLIPGDVITFAAKATAATIDVDCSMMWLEDT